jgi:hypothetical protein
MSGAPASPATPADGALRAQYAPVLHFEAPYLIGKLLRDHVADTPDEAASLFAEARKYLILSYIDTDVSWNMYSTRVDETWHQFVLFTSQYTDFCRQYFGVYLHHNPADAPQAPAAPTLKASTFAHFCARYQAFFGQPLPDIWRDERSVSLSRRVSNDYAGRARVTVADGVACLAGPGGRIDVEVSDIARDALEFIARTGAFHVRELPGALTDEEKVGLVATLVQHHVLRVAP